MVATAEGKKRQRAFTVAGWTGIRNASDIWTAAPGGVDHVHFHDVRHGTASGMINKGVGLFTVDRVLGHKDPRSTARYSHLETATLGTALAKLG
jgi:site-specific recombinase XerD